MKRVFFALSVGETDWVVILLISDIKWETETIGPQNYKFREQVC